jgi:hypothetical protein
MSDGFRRAYEALTRFISDHSEIEIDESVTSIPGDVRAEFYNLFNTAREAFVEEKFPGRLAEAELLLEQYRMAEDRNAGLFPFEDASAATEIQRFLSDPKEALARELFDLLFDLLKGRENIDSFETKAAGVIKDIFPSVYQGAYEKWVRLSLVELLEPDQTLGVENRAVAPAERSRPAFRAPMADAPHPAESTGFFFSQPRDLIFAVPDIIIHSPGLNRFVGIRTEFREGLYNAWYPSANREWRPISADLLKLLGCGLTLIYVAEQAVDIALVADASRFCRPDLILWCVDSQSWSKNEAMEITARAEVLLQPAKGIYVIANHPWPESAEPVENEQETSPMEQASQVRLLTVGYDQDKLTPIVEALVEQPGASEPSNPGD